MSCSFVIIQALRHIARFVAASLLFLSPDKLCCCTVMIMSTAADLWWWWHCWSIPLSVWGGLCAGVLAVYLFCSSLILDLLGGWMVLRLWVGCCCCGMWDPTPLLFPSLYITRVSDQTGVCQAWYIVEINHSGWKPTTYTRTWLLYVNCWTWWTMADPLKRGCRTCWFCCCSCFFLFFCFNRNNYSFEGCISFIKICFKQACASFLSVG